MIYEWIERNRKDIDILTSFLVTAIPVVMLYSEALGITENTIPYLIKYYYKSLHMKMNVKTFMKELNKIKSSMLANNLTMQQVKNVLDGMISQNKRVLSWFDSYVSQYADKNVKENPIHVCTENREVDMNVHEILRGKMTLDKVSDRIKNQCIDKLKNVFMQGSFDNRYNYL